MISPGTDIHNQAASGNVTRDHAIAAGVHPAPDAVVYNGDMVDDEHWLERLQPIVGRNLAPHKVVTWGNHDGDDRETRGIGGKEGPHLSHF